MSRKAVQDLSFSRWELKVVCKLAELHNTMAVAEEFGRDRSTINYVVRCVDKKLGREIFNRSVGRPGEEVTLTPYGEKAVPILHELLDNIEATDVRLGLIEEQ